MSGYQNFSSDLEVSRFFGENKIFYWNPIGLLFVKISGDPDSGSHIQANPWKSIKMKKRMNKISTEIKARGFRILWKSLKSLIFSSIFFKTLFIFSKFLENPPRPRGFAPRSLRPGSKVLGPSRIPPIGAGLKSRFPGRQVWCDIASAAARSVRGPRAEHFWTFGVSIFWEMICKSKKITITKLTWPLGCRFG